MNTVQSQRELLITQLTGFGEQFGECLPGEDTGRCVRGFAGLARIKWHLENADEQLMFEATLIELANAVGNLDTYITQLRQQEHPQYWTNFENSLAASLAILPKMPLRASTEPEASAQIPDLKTTIASLRRSIDAQGRSQEEKVLELEGERSRLLTEIEAVHSQASKTGVEYREKLDAVVANSRNREDSEKQMLIANIKEFDQFIADETARLRESIGIATDGSTTAHFVNIANDEKRAAFSWSVFAVAAAVGAAAIGAVYLYIVASQKIEFRWDLLTAKLVLVSAFGGIATYAGTRSSEHRHAQREAEFASTRLTAIRPFLRDVADGDSDEIVKLVAKEIFARPVEIQHRRGRSKESPSVIAQFGSVAQTAVEALAKKQS
jgi:hypothetical protein